MIGLALGYALLPFQGVQDKSAQVIIINYFMFSI